MSYGEYLKNLLRPLGVYRLEGTFNGAELDSIGGALDGVEEHLEETEREMCPLTARADGLERYIELLPWRPAAGTAEEMGEAIAALLRISGDSFTAAGISDNLTGCGIPAVVQETGQTGVVEVRFPTVAGQPEGIVRMQEIIEDIIPCHLKVEYVYCYITWVKLEEQFSSWSDLEANVPNWDALERML